MGQFYNSKRGAAWNYGGKNWKLSRSKIDLFIECPRCFYVDNKLGIKRPPGYPFTLNVAVDILLKKEFDIYRKAKKPHPLMKKYKVEAIPFMHEDLDIWRENFKGVRVFHKPTGMTISGAIDDVWVGKDGKLIVVDYKATAKDAEITLDAEWQDGYKRQMEVYQWLLRQNGFNVSDITYFVYVNGDKSKKDFSNKLEFNTKIIPYTGDDSWVDGKIREIHKQLEQDSIPKPDSECNYCNYRTAAGKIIQDKMGFIVVPKKKSKILKAKQGTEEEALTLF